MEKTMDFGGAIAALKQGKKVTRQGWNGKGMFLWLKEGNMIESSWCKDPMLKSICDANGGSAEGLATICMKTADNRVLAGWLASQTDMLAEDWTVTEERTQNDKTAKETIVLPEKRVKDGRPVTERINTMNDVLAELGPDHPLVSQYRHYLETTDPEQRDDYLATFMQLLMVTEAVNEGWHPTFTKDEIEHSYIPIIYVYKTLEEAEKYKMDAEIVVEIPESVRCVLLGGLASLGAYAGLAIAYSRRAPSIASAYVGSRLCFKTRELAKHAARNFALLWIKFYFM